MNLDFGEAALTLLGKAGWRRKRCIDQASLVTEMSTVGFEASGAASYFLEHFGLLRIEHDPSLTIDDRLVRSFTVFDPRRVCTARDADVAALCGSVIGKSLFPVGVDSFHLTIYISSDEVFYGGRDASVFNYADTFEGMLNKMHQGVRPERLADWG